VRLPGITQILSYGLELREKSRSCCHEGLAMISTLELRIMGMHDSLDGAYLPSLIKTLMLLPDARTPCAFDV